MKLLYFLCSVIGLTGCQTGLVEDNFLIVADSNDASLYQIDLSYGSSWKLPLRELTKPIGVAYNPVDQKVYWTDVHDENIKRSHLNGSDEEVITLLHSGSVPGGIAVDFISRLVYYTDGASDSIAVVTLNGSQHFTLLTEDMDQPRDIALDIARGMMYWTDRGEVPRIQAASMDGTTRKTIIRMLYTSWPIGLAVDHGGELLYWCDPYTDTIRSATLEGKDEKTLITKQTESHIFGIAFLQMNLYYTDMANHDVSKINISHSTPVPQQVGRATFKRPSGIAAYSSEQHTNDEAWNSPCRHLNGGCPHICLATPTGRRCACPDGLNFVSGTECSPPPYKCPQEHDEQKGSIQSPGYPGYRNNVHCVIIVRLNNTIRHERRLELYVVDFNLEPKYDYLVIGKTKLSGATLQGGRTYTVTTSDEDFRWLFVTDGSVAREGFSFRYEVVYCNSSKPCRNGGTCVYGEICQCPDGYEGNWCEGRVESTCLSNPCQNSGECKVKTSGYSCTCAIGTSGDHCEIDNCASVTCQHGGTCFHTLAGPFCQCVSGFTGQRCEEEVDECASIPCKNGATCVDQKNSFLCRCGGFFRGNTCEFDMNTCRSDPCLNGGSCDNLFDAYLCKCADGFTGDFCESHLPCAADTCHNGGTCFDTIAGPSCVCPPHRTGRQCDQVTLCKTKPCKNGGTCSESGSVRTCKCVDGFSGDSCDFSQTATVPASEKMRLNITLRLTNAEFKETLRDKDSVEYKSFRNNMEDALQDILDNTPGRGQYDIVDVTFSPGSVIVIYVIEMIKGASNPSAIETAIKEHRGTFAGYDMDQDSVGVSGHQGHATSADKKKGLNVATIGIIVGALVGFILVGIAVGETIYCLTKISRNRAAEHEAQNPPDTDAGQEPSSNRTPEMSSGYLSLNFDNPNFDAGDVAEDHYDTIGNVPMSHEH